MTNDQQPSAKDPTKVAPQVRPYVINAVANAPPRERPSKPQPRKQLRTTRFANRVRARRPKVNTFQKNRKTLVPGLAATRVATSAVQAPQSNPVPVPVP